MKAGEIVHLTRDCEAILIPMGNKLALRKGTPVRVTQTLGGSFTVVTEEGYLARIAGKDADALGKEVTSAPAPVASAPAEVTAESVKKMVWDQLKTCYDPEIPVNIADLGLIYLCQIDTVPEGGYQVHIKMTLTAPGCGMGESIRMDVQHKVLTVPGVKLCNVELVFEPMWNAGMMSEAAKLQLGMM